MKHLRTYILLFACLFIAFQGLAQDRHGKRSEKIDAAKTAFLTDKMQLTTDQAQKFWPLYNEYEEKKQEIRKKSRFFKDQNLEAMSDQQLKEAINTMHDFRQKELNLEKEYTDRFQKVISIRQLATMYKAEKEFTKVLLQKLNNSHGKQ